jgi:hypothetical protein
LAKIILQCIFGGLQPFELLAPFRIRLDASTNSEKESNLRESNHTSGWKIHMRYSFKALTSVCAALLSIQMAHAEGAPNQDFPQKKGYISAPDQHRAIVDCNYELGIGGYPKLRATYVAYPWGGDTVIRILADSNVSASEAAWINACADKKLGRDSGPANAKLTHRPRGNCPRYAPVLYGGSTYCIGS